MPFAAALFAAALSLTTAATPGSDVLPMVPSPLPAAGVAQASVQPPGEGISAAGQLRAGARTGALLTQGLREAATMGDESPFPVRQEIRSRGAVPLMAAGGALFIAGLLIGDDLGTLLAVGGAVVGSYGVYLYF